MFEGRPVKIPLDTLSLAMAKYVLTFGAMPSINPAGISVTSRRSGAVELSPCYAPFLNAEPLDRYNGDIQLSAGYR